MPKSPSSYSLVIQVISARSRTPRRAQLELEVDDVLERGALAGAGAVADADEEATPLAPAHPLDLLVERRRRLRRMLGQADGEAVAAVGAEPLGLVEAQRRPGRVDEEVVGHPRSPAVRLLGRHDGRGVVAVALGMDLPRRACTNSITVPLVDRREREGHLLGASSARRRPRCSRAPSCSRASARRPSPSRLARASAGERAAVWPAMPAPRTTTRLTDVAVSSCTAGGTRRPAYVKMISPPAESS